MITLAAKLYVRFLRLFQSPKTWLFTYFWVVAHIFSNTGYVASRCSKETVYRKSRKQCYTIAKKFNLLMPNTLVPQNAGG